MRSCANVTLYMALTSSILRRSAASAGAPVVAVCLGWPVILVLDLEFCLGCSAFLVLGLEFCLGWPVILVLDLEFCLGWSAFLVNF